jgi:hypothetical protein
MPVKRYILSMLVAASALVANAQQVSCTASAAPSISRIDGRTERQSDLVLSCSGGTPATANAQVVSLNIVLFLNTNFTNRITQSMGQFDDVLLLIDEPNTVANPAPLLNCGNTGATDSGASGPGVCVIMSTGNPAQTYDGTQNSFGTGLCTGGSQPAPNSYGCGRPNVFQGRVAPSPNQMNAVEFFGVPLDAPAGGNRTLRFTNIRGDAAFLGSPGTQILATVAISGPGPNQWVVTMPTTNEVALSTIEPGITATVPSPTPGTSTVHVVEGFASAWEPKNLAMTLANATGSSFPYSYLNGMTNYPPDVAQNVPGVFYNAESGFEWLNNSPNGPPSPNPPVGYGAAVADTGNPLFYAGFAAFDPGIMNSGVADAGTRIALTFTHLNGNDTVSVPTVVLLYAVGGSPTTPTGVMVLTATDVAGAGPFMQTAGSSVPAGNLAVYEVLYSDPAAMEYADIVCTLNHSGKGKGSVKVSVGFAPFYALGATPAPTAIPRFVPATASLVLF